MAGYTSWPRQWRRNDWHDPADRRTVRLEDAVSSVVDDIDDSPFDRVVLVAHSFSGVLVPRIAERIADRLVGVVFVAASVPQPGRSWAAQLPLPQRLLLRGLYTLRPAGLLSPEAMNRQTLCNDLDDDTTSRFLQRRVPEAPRLLLDPAPAAQFPEAVPVHYLRLLQDRNLAVPVQDRQVALLPIPNPHVHDLDTGHLPMLSDPHALASILDRIAREEAMKR